MEQPKIPTLKDAQKPQVKIKGMGAGLTLFDRLKQFKKKDLAFILAGLGTLFMAPLAEHFMMAPEGGASDMSSGFRGPGGSGGAGLFGGGSSPYENGNNSIAQGGAIGGGGDIITPLNVRDPSALVMGPGAAQQPNAGASTPSTPPPTAPARSETDYKDALAGAASRAASAAVKRAPLPMPKVALSGSQLRGLGAAGGGSSSGSGSLGPIGGGAGGTAGTGGGGLNLVRSAPNFRGAAGARGSNNPSGLDGTKKAGANAGDQFSRTGSALAGLNAAASETIPTGGSGFNGGGQGGAGANDKPGSGTGPGGSKSVGESLAFLEAKQRQEENLKLEFEKKKLKDNELLMYGIRNDIAKASATKIAELATTKLACSWLRLGCPPGNGDYSCTGGGTYTSFTPVCGAAAEKGAPAAGSNCWSDDGSGIQRFYPSGNGTGAVPTITCTPGKSKAADGAKQTDTGGSTAPPMASSGKLAAGAPTVGAGLDGACEAIDAQAHVSTVVGQSAANAAKTDTAYYTTMLGNARGLVKARTLLNAGGSATACKSSMATAGARTATAIQAEAVQKLQYEIPRMKGLVMKNKADTDEDIKAGVGTLADVDVLVKQARKQVSDANTELTKPAVQSFVVNPDNKDNKPALTATRQLDDAREQLKKDYAVIEGDQKALETALIKAQGTLGGTAPGTLSGVVEQNQAFNDMRASLETKKTEFAAKPKTPGDKDKWPAAKVEDPKPANLGSDGEPASVTQPIKTAKEATEAIVTLIGKAAPAADTAKSAPAAS
ncbi:MAG: hypothetical protein ABL955_06460, partial [Elusimicrobiota bacterium]